MQSLIWKSDPGKHQQESGRRNKERGGIQQQRRDSEQVTVVVSLGLVLKGTSERVGRTFLKDVSLKSKEFEVFIHQLPSFISEACSWSISCSSLWSACVCVCVCGLRRSWSQKLHVCAPGNGCWHCKVRVKGVWVEQLQWWWQSSSPGRVEIYKCLFFTWYLLSLFLWIT